MARMRSPTGHQLLVPSPRWSRRLVVTLALILMILLPPRFAQAGQRPISLRDVLDVNRVERAVISPGGDYVAVVVQRAARPGEVYGRTFYELDPSRNDVWIISLRTGQRRNITNGVRDAAGFWCPIWSPDGARLAMLSTRSARGEPRGGNNVRLYVWDVADVAPRRLNDAPLMTQTRGGSALYKLDIRGPSDRDRSQRCSDEDGASFVWLDSRRVLAVTLPGGAVSGLIDEFGRPLRHSAATAAALRLGTQPTMTAVGSGGERMSPGSVNDQAILRIMPVDGRRSTRIADIPIYPFRGELSVSASPDGRRAAVLATTGAIQPAPTLRIPNSGDDNWTAEKRLGIVDLAPAGQMHWVSQPEQSRLPLELYGWSGDGSRVAFRARGRPDADSTPVFLASAKNYEVMAGSAEERSIGGTTVSASYAHPYGAVWIDDRHLLLRTTQKVGAGKASWQIVELGMRPIEVGGEIGGFFQAGDGRIVAIAGSTLSELDAGKHRLERVAALPPGSAMLALDAGHAVTVSRDTLQRQVVLENPSGRSAGVANQLLLPETARILDVNPSRRLMIWLETTASGELVLKEASFADRVEHALWTLNADLTEIDWGRTAIIDYRSTSGAPLKAAVIFPPGYRTGRKYPTLTWVYAGYEVRGPDDYFLDRYMPGIYNLRLYAARGYVVLIPSIPLTLDGKHDIIDDIPKGVIPAIDRLVSLGISDPDKVGVMGQSFGGYSVYALVTQTDRFKAAVAASGISDLQSYFGQFDANARGYPGIEHERSYNWALMDQFGAQTIPYGDDQYYRRNSPITYVDRVTTPLLLIHGEYDVRGQMSQAEAFFYSLYQRGKTARLLRYWGESHALSQSPANVQSEYDEIVAWFDKYLKPPTL